jgi:hypothetical protein
MLPSLLALDFKPTIIETVMEAGFKNREVVLRDGNSEVIYCPPARWEVEEGSRSLKFHPPGVSFADLTIESDPVTAPRTVDDAEINRCVEWLKRSIPRESTDVQVEAGIQSPVCVGDCQTLAVTVAYTGNGNRFRKRVIFIFAPTDVIRCTLVARPSDFDRLYTAVRRSLFTWRWEKPK